jgi:hypothetical protein
MEKITPIVAAVFGYDYEGMSDLEKVTLVRRRVVYEELVMSKNELKKINRAINKDDDEFFLSELEMEDIQFPDYTEELTEYIAFPGDVTSGTDDAIAYLFKKQPWSEQYEPVRLASQGPKFER